MDNNKLRFMIVDDDADDRFLFTEAVKRVGENIEVISADGGKQMFQLLDDPSAPEPDVIFLDVNMVEMSGWDCLRLLKSNEGLQNIPVIIYSTSSSPADIKTASELGAVTYCVKPDNFDEQKLLVNVVVGNLTRDLKGALKKSGLKCIRE